MKTMLSPAILLMLLVLQQGAAIAAEKDAEEVASGAWVQSDNGDLAIRLLAKPSKVSTKESFSVTAQVRNDRKSPVTILRPFGDAYYSEAVQIKLWSGKRRIAYSGPKYDYDLTADAFVTLAPGEIATGTIQLSVDHFAGTDKPGNYTLRYDYAYDGAWDKTVALDGIKAPWLGHITTREIHVVKEEARKATP